MRILKSLRTMALMSAALVSVQCARPSVEAEVVATVEGREITLAEVDRRWSQLDPASRMQAQQQMYEGRAQALNQLIGERMIELAAQTRGMPPEMLLETEIVKRASLVTEDDVDKAYRDAGEQAASTPLDHVRPRIREYLQQQRSAAAAGAFVEELIEASGAVAITLDPPRLDVRSLPADPAHGPADAPVTIVEFSDFECRFCKQAVPTLAKIRATFGDRVRIVYRDAPLPNHPAAYGAAEAAQCAHEQGKFWPYHDLLFANSPAFDAPRLKEYARTAGLDAARFDACLDGGIFRPAVEEDIADAQRYGVSSTPTFFVNGRIVMGAVAYETLEQIVREELERGR
ncbi:MAG TPA: thioredoxin domain-containing protein [Vicinamibacterales bacterium]|nr:thioredoxin domain-containing protein [Vicinamibacterales bacterium]